MYVGYIQGVFIYSLCLYTCSVCVGGWETKKRKIKNKSNVYTCVVLDKVYGHLRGFLPIPSGGFSDFGLCVYTISRRFSFVFDSNKTCTMKFLSSFPLNSLLIHSSQQAKAEAAEFPGA